ncbi:hypothetical protein P5673_001250 [Acropora cervicornis]|uniref:Uncharacterized protein n=1 Tax=Acropora cervicornis TaxID=6130 RepID=A0AAD9R649_ACRCE|nr:hypothetical protein P5673_001250 [Acropora cervicornis]
MALITLDRCIVPPLADDTVDANVFGGFPSRVQVAGEAFSLACIQTLFLFYWGPRNCHALIVDIPPFFQFQQSSIDHGVPDPSVFFVDGQARFMSMDYEHR